MASSEHNPLEDPMLYPCDKRCPSSVVAQWALLIFLTVLPTCSAHAKQDPPSPENRRLLERHLSELKPLLEEYRQGKRDASDGHAVIRKMLHYHGILGSTATVEAQQLIKEWRELRKQHPEFHAAPPIEIREQREARKIAEEKRREAKQKAKSWTPSDAWARKYYQHENHVVLAYQYRLEFFTLKPAQQVKKTADPEAGRLLKFYEGDRPINLTPHRVMTFADVIVIEPTWPSRDQSAILICTDPILGYAPTTSEQVRFAIAGRPKHRRPNAEFQSFCGAVGINGKIVGKIPIKQDPPENYVAPLGLLPDGTEALLGIGTAQYNDNGIPNISKYRDLLLWRRPDHLRRVPLVGLSEREIEAYRERFGVSAIPH